MSQHSRQKPHPKIGKIEPCYLTAISHGRSRRGTRLSHLSRASAFGTDAPTL